MPDGYSKASAQMKRKHEKEEKKHQARLKKRRATLVSLDQNLKNKKWVAAEDCKVFSPGELKLVTAWSRAAGWTSYALLDGATVGRCFSLGELSGTLYGWATA